MIVRKLRLKHGWTQGQLAEMVGVTTRTIQRIEQGQNPSLETSKALASVFEVDLSIFQPEDLPMNQETTLKNDEQEAIMYGKKVKEFLEQLLGYFAISAIFLFTFDIDTQLLLILGGIGVCIIIYGLITFEVFNFITPDIERKIIEKKLGRKL